MSSRPRSLPLAALGSAVALVLAGCSADPLNVVILNARAPGDKCDFADATLYTEGGPWTSRPGRTPTGTPGRPLPTARSSPGRTRCSRSPISVNGQVVDPGGGSDFIADTAVYSYQYTRPERGALAGDAEPPGGHRGRRDAGRRTRWAPSSIQPQAAAALNATVTATPQTLLVTFQLFGKTGAGREQEHQQGHASRSRSTGSPPAGVACPARLRAPRGDPATSPGATPRVHCVQSG